jgi:lipid II:glycine glycyltransferase (peptidoglycan interpeptide bridge formation enzyme)
MTLVIREVSDAEQWNTYVSRSLYGHLLQSYEWGELTRILGSKVVRLGAFEDEVLTGTMQIAINPVPFPFLHFCWLYCVRGPSVLSSSDSALPSLILHAHSIGQREHAVVLRVEPNIADNMPDENEWINAFHALHFRDYPFAIHGRRSWVLDITSSLDTLFKHFKMTWRQNVRVAERKGVSIREASNNEDILAYYTLLQVTSKRDSFFIHPLEYHQAIYQKFKLKGDAVLFLAEYEGKAIAAKMLIRYGNWCWDMFGASSNQFRNLKATYLLQYRCIQWAKEHNCTHFDFRTIPEYLEPETEMWGVYEYKQGFGGYSRLNIPTQDFVYRSVWYAIWVILVRWRRFRRKAIVMHRKKR